MYHVLTHSCDIERLSVTQNTIGEMVESWATRYSEVPCRLFTKTVDDAAPDSTRQVLEQYYLILKRHDGTTISTGDRITNIMERGATNDLLDDGPFYVAAVMPRRGKRHKFFKVVLEKRV